MWDLVYAFMKLTGSDGLSPRRPTPPTWITDHSFPTPPGGGYGVDDDPTRGADVEHHHGFNWLDLLLAVLAWIVFIAEVIIWLVTIIPSLALRRAHQVGPRHRVPDTARGLVRVHPRPAACW